MRRSRAAAMWLHSGLVCVMPPEFKHRYRDEMQLDFLDQLHTCLTRMELAVTTFHGCADLVVTAIREWRRHDLPRMLAGAASAHASIWLFGMAIAAMEWPRGSRLRSLVLTFALLSLPGIALTVWRQVAPRRRCCSLRAAELD
jgi:hypothetical protein